MNEAQSLLEELDGALASNAIVDRARALRRVTDLFLTASAAYSEPEIAVFDHVMWRLAQEMETSLRAVLAARLAKVPNAPKTLMRTLANDQAIEVAGPVLRSSARLDDPTLVATAMAASQDHLLAISERATISEAVTDVLVERGDRIVALSTVCNAGARFSQAGHGILVERSKDDEELAVGVWSRTDVPHHQLLKLFSQVTENVRQKLEAADRGKTHYIRDMMVGVANEMQNQMRAKAHDYVEAERQVSALYRAGELNDAKVLAFASSGHFDATTVALSILCDLPIGACERAMVQDRAELVLMLARAVGLSWETTKAILRLRAGEANVASKDLVQCLNSFTKLKADTAGKALQFLRMRERAAISNPGPSAFH
jgi:uncharacterized protein (DUF2336 family)